MGQWVEISNPGTLRPGCTGLFKVLRGRVAGDLLFNSISAVAHYKNGTDAPVAGYGPAVRTQGTDWEQVDCPVEFPCDEQVDYVDYEVLYSATRPTPFKVRITKDPQQATAFVIDPWTVTEETDVPEPFTRCQTHVRIACPPCDPTLTPPTVVITHVPGNRTYDRFTFEDVTPPNYAPYAKVYLVTAEFERVFPEDTFGAIEVLGTCRCGCGGAVGIIPKS